MNVRNGLKTRVLFVVARNPFPPHNGRAVCINNYAKYLHDYCDCEVYMLCVTDKQSHVTSHPSYVKFVATLHRSSMFVAALKFLGAGFGRPLQSLLYYRKQNLNAIENLIEQERITVVLYDMVRSAEYMIRSNLKVKSVLDMDDLLSERYLSSLNASSGGPIGSAGGNAVVRISRLLDRLNVWKPLLMLEIRALRNFEIFASKRADDIILVSNKEAEQLTHATGKSVVVAPIGVDVSLLQPEGIKVRRNLISFMGALDYPPNSDALIGFLENSWPRIRQLCPDAELRVIGGQSPPALSKRQIAYTDAITFLGRVHDLRPSIQESCVFVAPMRYGSGLNTKIIEAMAMGVPVVTTSVGAEGIISYDSSECPLIVKDTPLEFATAVVEVINNPEYREHLSTEGLKYVRRWFDIHHALRPLSAVLQ